MFDGSYPRCQQHNEDSFHLLVSCPVSKGIWMLDGVPRYSCKDFRSWLRLNMTLEEIFRGLPWAIVFPYKCHEVWKDRNNCVFKSQDPSPIKVISFRASRCTREFVLAFSKVITSIVVNHCFAHPLSHVMIHDDAYFTGIGEVVGIEGVVRDHRRQWIMGLGKKIYTNHFLAAELLAILEAM